MENVVSIAWSEAIINNNNNNKKKEKTHKQKRKVYKNTHQSCFQFIFCVNDELCIVYV